jgi:hypothetical protein
MAFSVKCAEAMFLVASGDSLARGDCHPLEASECLDMRLIGNRERFGHQLKASELLAGWATNQPGLLHALLHGSLQSDELVCGIQKVNQAAIGVPE